MKNLAFVVGFVLETYGLFAVAASGAILKGALWILAGICLQIAGGAAPETGTPGRLVNPFVVLGKELRSIRLRVQKWNERA